MRRSSAITSSARADRHGGIAECSRARRPVTDPISGTARTPGLRSLGTLGDGHTRNVGEPTCRILAAGRRQPGAAARRGGEDPGDRPRRDAGRGDAAQGRHRGRRQPRQDDHHVADRARARRGRARPDRGGRRSRAVRRARAIDHAPGNRRAVGRGGRRERRLIPAAGAGDRGRDQHRSRAPRPLRQLPSAPGRVRRVLQPRAVLGRVGVVRRPSGRAGDRPADEAPHDPLRHQLPGRLGGERDRPRRARPVVLGATSRRGPRARAAAPVGASQRAHELAGSRSRTR